MSWEDYNLPNCRFSTLFPPMLGLSLALAERAKFVRRYNGNNPSCHQIKKFSLVESQLYTIQKDILSLGTFFATDSMEPYTETVIADELQVPIARLSGLYSTRFYPFKVDLNPSWIAAAQQVRILQLYKRVFINPYAIRCVICRIGRSNGAYVCIDEYIGNYFFGSYVQFFGGSSASASSFVRKVYIDLGEDMTFPHQVMLRVNLYNSGNNYGGIPDGCPLQYGDNVLYADSSGVFFEWSQEDCCAYFLSLKGAQCTVSLRVGGEANYEDHIPSGYRLGYGCIYDVSDQYKFK